MILEFEVQNQTLSRKENNKTVENSRNYLQCAFTFSEDWDGLTKAVLFKSIDMEKPVAVLLTDENICNIPNGATTQHLSIAVVGGSNTFISSLTSESAVDNDGTVITTNTLSIPFDDTLDTDCMADLNEPQNDFTKFLQQINSFKGSLETRMSGIEQTLSEKVDKVTGKELSANDFTDTLKSKLDGIESGAQKNTVVSVAGKTGTVTLSKSDVGLGNADNTSDSDKPVSTAQQAALDLKADQASVDNVSADIDTINKALDGKADKTDVDTALSTKANQSDVDTINAVLSGAIKNKGSVKSLTIPLPVTDKSMLNCAYNVISGWILGTENTIYAWSAFQYKLKLNHIKIYVDTTTDKYYLELSSDTDIPAELWYLSVFGEKEFYNAPQTVAIMLNDTVQRFKYVGYSNTQTPYEKLLRFEWQTTPNSTDISTFRDALDWVYTADNVTASWSVSMNIDDNFVVTEHGFDIQSYKITNYVTPYELTQGLNGKVDKVTGKELSANDFTDTLKSKLDGIESGAQKNTVVSVAGKTGTVTLSKSDVGLGNADNTSDSDKPVSTAQQAALDLKADQASVDNVSADIDTINKALDGKADKTDVDTALSTKANQSDVDTINAVLSGAIKNKGSVKSLTIPLPVTDKSMLNCAYNVISGWILGTENTIYAWSAFQYKLKLNHIKIYVDTTTDKYYLELSSDTDIPAELWYLSVFGEKEFYNAPQTVAIMLNDTVQRFKYVGYSNTQTPYEKLLRFEWQTTPNSTDISTFRDALDWVYTADNVTASWSVSMNIDDNFVVTEHGFDIQSYKITNYVTPYELTQGLNGKVDKVTGKGLSTNDFTTALKTKLNNDYTKSQIDAKISALQDGKANVADVYTKTETDSAISALQAEIDGTGKYDTIIDYTYTGEEPATELNIMLTVEQLQKIKKYEKFLCYVTYNVSATTGTTGFWATAALNLCNKGTTTPLGYAGMFMRAANTVQKITADNTPITWIATTEKVRLPNSDVCITNVLDYGGTQYNMFNMSTLLGGSSRTCNYTLYKNSETNYDWVMQLKSPTAMPFTNGMKFIMWGK